MDFQHSSDNPAGLSGNPFYILNLSITADRRAVSAAVDEMSFLRDPTQCSQAQQELLTPDRRLAAELDWFPETDSTTLAEIRQAIAENRPISWTALSGISRLNAQLYDLQWQKEDAGNMADRFTEISDAFSGLIPEELSELLNHHRSRARMPEVTGNAVSTALQKKRDSIRRVLSKKAEKLSREAYGTLIDQVSQKAFAQNISGAQIVLEDQIDAYELSIQPMISDCTSQVESQLTVIRGTRNPGEIAKAIDEIRSRFAEISSMLTPIQKKAQVSGIQDRTSEALAIKIRETAVMLHNERDDTASAIALMEGVLEFFRFNQKASERMEKDLKLLRNNLQSQALAQKFSQGMDEIQKITEKVKQKPGFPIVDELILAMRKLDGTLKNYSGDPKEVLAARFAVCVGCRQTALKLNNEMHQPVLSYVLIRGIAGEFSDIHEFTNQFYNDLNALRKMIPEQMLAMLDSHDPEIGVQRPVKPAAAPSGGNYRGRNNEENDWRNKKVILWVLAVVVLMVFFLCSNMQNIRGIYTPNPTRAQTYVNVETTEQTTEAAEETTEPIEETTKPPECLFTPEVEVGRDVYAEIVSIVPAVGLYYENSDDYFKFVCRCETVDGDMIYTSMPAVSYQRLFDQEASLSVNASMGEPIRFDTPKIIHGICCSSESVKLGLTFDIYRASLIQFVTLE